MSRLRAWKTDHDPLVRGIALGCLTALGGALRLWRIGAKSLWYDEAVIYWISTSDVRHLVSANAHQNSAPPLYVLLVRLVGGLGRDEGTLRLVSLIAGVLAIPAIYLLVREYTGARAALVASLVVAISPVYVEYSQELREYSLAFLLSALMLLAYSKFRATASWRNAVFVAGSFCVGVLTQYGLALLVLSLNLAWLLETDWRSARVAIRMWVLAQAACLLVIAWLIPTTLRFQFTQGGFSYVSRGYFEGPLETLAGFIFRQSYEVLLFAFPDPPLVILLMGTAIVAGVSARGSVRRYAHLFTPFGVAVAAGILGVYPYVGARQSIYLLPIVCVLIGLGFDYLFRVDGRAIVPVLVALLVTRAAVLPTLGYLRSEGLENLKPLARELEANLLEGDRVFVCTGAIPAFRYYFQGPESIVTEASSGEAWQEELSGLLSAPGRIWLIISHCGEESTFVDFAAARRPVQEVGSSAQAWLFLAP
jgi:hypothetical protein